MGKPISAVAGVSAGAGVAQQSPVQSPTQSPVQSPVQSSPPAPKPPVKFWPPAYGWRLDALQGERAAHNGWQSKWLQHGVAAAGGGPVDAVADLKVALRGRLDKSAR